MAQSSAPLLTDGVVRLRPHTCADAEAILEQCTDPDTLRWTTVPRGYTRDDASDFVEHIRASWAEPNGNRYWAIEFVAADGPRFGGTIDLRRGETPSTANLGFGLHPTARGRGVMSRAVRLAAAHAFTAGLWGVPVERIHWRSIVGNWGSRRVAWATGFTFHGVLPATHVDPANPLGPGLDAWHASLARGDEMRAALPWLEPKVLEGKGIRLRPWRESDAESIEERDDPAHWMGSRAWLTQETFPQWLMLQRTRAAEGQAVPWCIADASTDRALGSVAVFARGGALDGDVAELGYWLNPSARGRGVVKEASRLAVDFALRPLAEGGLGLRRLVGETAADNEASNRVLQSVGFVEFGREHATDDLPDGSHGDALHWELLPGSGLG